MIETWKAVKGVKCPKCHVENVVIYDSNTGARMQCENKDCRFNELLDNLKVELVIK